MLRMLASFNGINCQSVFIWVIVRFALSEKSPVSFCLFFFGAKLMVRTLTSEPENWNDICIICQDVLLTQKCEI